MEQMKQFVKTIEGCYDEEAKAVSMNINVRRHCWMNRSHEFINASLHWENRVVSGNTAVIPFENEQLKWGTGYGGIRFCKKCKWVDCIHNFLETKRLYVGTEANHLVYLIGVCSFCKRRILRDCYRVITAEDQARVVDDSCGNGCLTGIMRPDDL